MDNPRCSLTTLENLSLTATLVDNINGWRFGAHPKWGELGTRVVGFIATPLTALIDAIAHIFLCAGKVVVGAFVSAYNFVAEKVKNATVVTRDLELSSALVHVARIVDHAVRIPLLPVLMLMNPDRGTHLAMEPQS